MLSVYGDESADETKQRVFTVAGVIGSEEDWENLERKWIARTGGVPFHANDCESDRGDFSSFAHKDNQELYRDLTIALATSGLGGWAVSINLIDQHKVFPDAHQGLTYHKGLLEVVEKMKNAAMRNGETVEFIFDMRRETEYNAGRLYEMAKNTASWSPYISPKIHFACSRECRRIQVADLFAREAMKALDNQIGPIHRPPRKSWLKLHDTGRFHVDVLGEEWFRDLQKQLPEIEQGIGMSMAEYAQWLVSTKKMVDNVSHRFEYMQYAIERDRE